MENKVGKGIFIVNFNVLSFARYSDISGLNKQEFVYTIF